VIDGRPITPWPAEPYINGALWPSVESAGLGGPDEALPEAYTATEPVGFDSYVRSRSAPLLRLAYLLTGDHHRAKDLVQATLTKLLPRWERVAARGDPHAYVRTVMLHTALGWRRRKWEAERPTGDLPDRPADRDPAVAVDDRERLRRALLRLPPRQRAAVVLRHYEDLTEAQAAAALGCSAGTVKTHTARGLDRLRVLLTDD
jgi:RNA polymerase sigma-70 factor (sigma-E family)